MEKSLDLITKTFTVNIGKLEVSPTYWQAGTIIFLIFLLLLTLARVRYLYVNWSLGKSSIAFLFWGFLLAVIFEGFMIVGGRTILTEILGWKNLPKPIGTVLDLGRERLARVLGESVSEVPTSSAMEQTDLQSILAGYGKLSIEDVQKVQDLICKP